MGINVVIDEALVAEAKKLTGIDDESAAVEELLRRSTGGGKPVKRPSLSRYAGTFDFDQAYDVLKERGARGLSD